MQIFYKSGLISRTDCSGRCLQISYKIPVITGGQRDAPWKGELQIQNLRARMEAGPIPSPSSRLRGAIITEAFLPFI